MKIAAWNVNSLRKRQERVGAWLATAAPDVLCIQETKCPDELFPSALWADAGYASAFHGQKSYNGVAILSKTPIADVRKGFGDSIAEPQSRIIAATIGSVRVISAYAPNGQAVGAPAFHEKLRWFERLAIYLENELRTYPLLAVCGDFNVAPADRDVHDPRLWQGCIMCSEPERTALARVEALGLRDTFRLIEPRAGFFTWWDYRMLSFPKNRGLRIDLVFASPALAATCTGAGIDREARKGAEPSDHAPIWAEFRV
jgi:exodeoxyribonuclease-3